MQPDPPGFNPYAAPLVVPTGAGAPPGPGRLSIDGAFGRAFETMKRFLFRPFNFGKMFVFGFIVWIAELGEGGTSLPTTNTSLPSGEGAAARAAAPRPRPTSATRSRGCTTTRER